MAALLEKLKKAKVSEQATNFILKVKDSKVRGSLVNEAFKNPNVEVSFLKKLIPKKSIKTDIDLSFAYDARIKTWLKNQLGPLKEKNKALFNKYYEFVKSHYYLLNAWNDIAKPKLTTTDISSAAISIISMFLENKDYKFYKTRDVVHECADGFTIQRVKEESDMRYEGQLMNNCLKDNNPEDWNYSDIYSLRDARNKPHVTIAINRDGYLDQMAGKGNSEVKRQYVAYLIPWLSKTAGWNNLSFELRGDDGKVDLTTYTDQYGELLGFDGISCHVDIKFDGRKLKASVNTFGYDLAYVEIDMTNRDHSYGINFRCNSKKVVATSVTYSIKSERYLKSKKPTVVAFHICDENKTYDDCITVYDNGMYYYVTFKEDGSYVVNVSKFIDKHSKIVHHPKEGDIRYDGEEWRKYVLNKNIICSGNFEKARKNKSTLNKIEAIVKFYKQFVEDKAKKIKGIVKVK